MERLVVINNPRSTNNSRFDLEVRQPIVEYVRGIGEAAMQIVWHEITSPYSETIVDLAKILQNKDYVIAAGGDGTISAGLNGCMLSEKDVRFGALGLGRGNDGPLSVTGRSVDPVRLLKASTIDFAPLELIVNDEHVAFAMQHIALGWGASASDAFGQNARQNLGNKAKTSIAAGAFELFDWHKRIALDPNAAMPTPYRDENDTLHHENNVICALGRTARILWPKADGYPPRTTLHSDRNKFFVCSDTYIGGKAEINRLVKSAVTGFPGEISQRKSFVYDAPQPAIMCTVDGELIDIRNISRIDIKRADKSLRLLAPKLTKSKLVRPLTSR